MDFSNSRRRALQGALALGTAAAAAAPSLAADRKRPNAARVQSTGRWDKVPIHQGARRMVHGERSHRSLEQPSGARSPLVRRRDVRAGSANPLAYTRAWADAYRHSGMRLDAVRGRRKSGDPCRRRDLVSAESQALAWRYVDDSDDAYRRSGGTRREASGVAGTCFR